MGDATVNVAGGADNPSGAEPDARVANGLYTLGIEMSGAKSGHATGVAVLHGGRILGGDSFFYYTGSYSFGRGKWRGEMIVHQHTEAPGLNLVFGGREVTCVPAAIPPALPTSTAPRWSADTAFPFARG
jgi:hypothetical protein